MEEENTIGEIKESMEKLEEFTGRWSKYLAITTAFIAVIAAIATLQSGNFANQALLEKNDAVLLQSKASDQYNYYQAKGIKKNIAEASYLSTKDEKQKQEAQRYDAEQRGIQKTADAYEAQAAESNKQAEHFLEQHHRAALAVTFFQIAIALSAMSALLKRKSFWYLSLALTAGGLVSLLSSFFIP